jgi:CheY-like chemotaxis protein
MNKSRLDPKRGLADGSGAASNFQIDPDRALVVAKSRINRVVVSKILERSGLKSISLDPETALRTLEASLPAMVVLDGGADNRECEALVPRLALLRAATANDRPRVILLTNRKAAGNQQSTVDVIDAVVVKPITTELLQPVVDRLMQGMSE